MFCGFVALSSPRLSAMLRFATYQEITRPGRRLIMDKEIGCTLCQTNGPPPCLILCCAGASSIDLASMPQGQVNLVAARPQHPSDAITSWTLWVDMLASAIRDCTRVDTIVCVTTLPLWPPGGIDGTNRAEYVYTGSDLGAWRACPAQC